MGRTGSRDRRFRQACPVGSDTRCRGVLPTTLLQDSFMLTLRLPDGSVKQVAEGTRPREIAEGIGKRLAQAAVAARVNGEIVDLNRELSGNGTDLSFQVLTEKDPEAL